MKKFLILALAIMIPVTMSAQAQINTKKVKIEDFTEKTTKVVLTGNIFFMTASGLKTPIEHTPTPAFAVP